MSYEHSCCRYYTGYTTPISNALWTIQYFNMIMQLWEGQRVNLFHRVVQPVYQQLYRCSESVHRQQRYHFVVDNNKMITKHRPETTIKDIQVR